MTDSAAKPTRPKRSAVHARADVIIRLRQAVLAMNRTVQGKTFDSVVSEALEAKAAELESQFGSISEDRPLRCGRRMSSPESLPESE